MSRDSHGLVAGLAGFGVSQTLPFDVGRWLAHFGTSVAVGFTVWLLTVIAKWLWQLIRKGRP